jgi:hypothetical protein
VLITHLRNLIQYTPICHSTSTALHRSYSKQNPYLIIHRQQTNPLANEFPPSHSPFLPFASARPLNLIPPPSAWTWLAADRLRPLLSPQERIPQGSERLSSPPQHNCLPTYPPTCPSTYPPTCPSTQPLLFIPTPPVAPPLILPSHISIFWYSTARHAPGARSHSFPLL